MLKRIITATVVAGLSLSLVPASAAPAETRNYTAVVFADLPITLNCKERGGLGDNSILCFPNIQVGSTYDLSVADTVSGSTVAYYYSWDNADGDCVGSDPDDPLGDCDHDGIACGNATLTAPPGAKELYVSFYTVALSPIVCLDEGVVGYATTGVFRVHKQH